MSRQTHSGAAVAVALLVVALPACTPETPLREGPSTRVIATEPFESELARLRGERLIPGLSVAVVRNQEVVLARGFGYADIGASIDADENTPYRIASVTKPISGTLAMKLVEIGTLDLDQAMAETPWLHRVLRGVWGHGLVVRGRVLVQHDPAPAPEPRRQRESG